MRGTLAVGPTIFVLMLTRLAWRLAHPGRYPPPPADLAPPLRVLARATHWGFYAVLIVLPMLGWLSASAYGVRPYLLGLIPLPLLLAQNDAAGEAIGRVHGAFALVLLAIMGLHISGALFHA